MRNEPSDSDKLTESLPERIWLQVDPDSIINDRSEPIQRDEWETMTWSYEKVGGTEVEYVRADVFERLRDALMRITQVEAGLVTTTYDMRRIATNALTREPNE